MKRKKTEILASLKTKIYNGFGGWRIKKDNKVFYEGNPRGEWESFPTLMKFELAARKSPGDWKAHVDLPLRSACYQRQGKNRWVLIESGMGFA